MGIQERRGREKEQRRNEILNAAEKVFFSKGFNQSTMDEVAETAELSKGTLYLYFKNKEDLYFAITYRSMTILRSMFKDAVKQHKKGIEKVRAIGRAYHRFSQDYKNYFNMMMHFEAVQNSLNLDACVFDEMHLHGQSVMQVLVEAIQTGVDDGSIRSNIDPLKTAFLLNGVSSGIIHLIARESQHIKKMEAFEPEELMDTFFDFTVNALKPKE
ncbi:TetR/AcrR family transcriptional regulator [Calditrichota bacterium]